MNIGIRWIGPYEVINGKEHNLIYYCDNLDKIENGFGVYVFFRKCRGAMTPVYIGKSKNLRKRIEQQFKNNVPLMSHLKKSYGKIYLLVGNLTKPKTGKSRTQAISIVEKKLIEKATASGYNLFNIQGTRGKLWEITFSGSRAGTSFFPKEIGFK